MRTGNLVLALCVTFLLVGIGLVGLVSKPSSEDATDAHAPEEDSVVLTPGPGVGALVYYDPGNGEIHSLVLYSLSNPVPHSPQAGEAVIDVTNDPNYPALFDEFRRGVSELTWYVDLSALTLKHR